MSTFLYKNPRSQQRLIRLHNDRGKGFSQSCSRTILPHAHDSENKGQASTEGGHILTLESVAGNTHSGLS